MRFSTLTGSVYEVNDAARSWRRLTGQTRGLRTESGEFLKRSAIREGENAQFVCEPLTEGAVLRIITTSLVTAIE